MKGCRAAVENEAVHESRRLASGMIAMSITISGAPFLGLLGTVWGIMNTFAALTESGEASLALFAPGVAAALSTTVAGLVIAIPALFAYTYLAYNIKNFNADVKLFAENFLFKLEEGRRDTP
jgi:biopolymer transport protein ExbB